jgi:hypothetical protein
VPFVARGQAAAGMWLAVNEASGRIAAADDRCVRSTIRGAIRMKQLRTGRERMRAALTFGAAAAALALAALPHAAHAQAVVMAGNYQNFDVLNNNGQEACGFEMEVWGVNASQLTRIFPSNFNAGVIRYGFGSATDFPGGTYVRWMSPYDPASGRFTSCTPVPPSMTTVPGDSCWTLGMPNGAYQASGCEHFGISTTYSVNATKILYRWLLPDPNTPGNLIRAATDVSIPAPIWQAIPPANPALPPVVVAQVEAPPPPQPAVFGDAQWVRVYKAEQPGKVDLDQLVGDNHAVVPENAAQLETNWSLLQQDPPGGGNQRRRGKLVNQGGAGNGNHAVVRRYEYYKYAGMYDPITHEALCADLTCTAPSAGELGEAIGAQNAAANLDVNALSVTVAGGSNVQSSDKTFSCPNKCYGVYAPGATVTLTAKANSGSAFSAWSGACAGNAATCTVPMNAESTVTATFVTVAGGGGGGAGAGGGGGGGGAAPANAKLSVSLGNPGLVTSADGAINCGAGCAATYAAGATVTLTATPLPGLAFVNWSGACSTAVGPVCTLTMSKDLAAKANFTK